MSYNRTNAYQYANYYSNKYCHDGYYGRSAYPYYGQATPGAPIDDSVANADCAHFVSCCIGNHGGTYPGGGLNLSYTWNFAYGLFSSTDLAEDLLNKGYAVSVSPVDDLEQGGVIIYNYGGGCL